MEIETYKYLYNEFELELFEKLNDKLNNKISFYKLSSNPNITQEFIEKYITKDWDWEYLINNNKNKNLTEEFKITLKNKFVEEFTFYGEKYIMYNKKDWEKLSLNKDIDLEFIEKYNDKLDFWNLSDNPNLTEDFIKKYIYKNWCWGNNTTNFGIYYGMNRFDDNYNDNKISLEFFNKYHTTKWRKVNGQLEWEYNFEQLSHFDDNLSLDFIEENINEKWDFWYLSGNPNITEEFLEKYIDKNWCWGTIYGDYDSTLPGLSYNNNLSLEFIEKHIDKEWDWMIIASRTDLTKEFILKHFL